MARSLFGWNIAGAVMALVSPWNVATTPAYAQAVVPEARAALPESVRQSGVLKVAGGMVWAPFNWIDHGRITGMEIDLITLLSRKLGVRPQISDIKFATLIPSIRNRRFDVALGQLGITPKREKVLRYVPNFRTDYALLVRKGTTDVDINNLCGRKLAATVGSGQLPVIQSISDACVQSGRKPVGIDVYGDPLNTYLALSNGRGDGYMVAKGPGIYITRRNPKLALSPGILRGQEMRSGFVVSRDRPDLQRALSLALDSARRDGSYLAILKKYALQDGAIAD
ncbi:transporter substrate-binding domain-containing protein [Sphingobium sp.]|uniref:transporter substrate-binding domain-containing protein n=1 Tax=Sphingobium sp. TaxID=1912891 RepID=UPI00262348FA|nr:transporter substrate-binding domain-containing protein [Sphingobium sp.]